MNRPTLHQLHNLPARIGRHADRVVGVLLIALGMLTLYGSRNLPSTAVSTDIGAGAFPMVYAGILIVLAILLILNAHTTPGTQAEQNEDSRPSLLRVLGGGALTLVYIISIPFTGFPVATPVFMFVLMWLLGFRRILPSLCISAGFTAVLYLAFEVGMSVALPVGSLFE